MNEQLVKEIAILEEQARIFTIDRDKATNEQTQKALQDEIDNVNRKIEAKRQQIEAVEEDIQATQTAIIEAFDQIVVEGQVFSLRDFAMNEQSAQFLSAWIQQKVGEVAQQYSAQVQSYKHENDELKLIIEDKDSSIAGLRQQNDRLDLLGADLQAKRDAAASEILELQETIKRLNEDMRTLRENVAVPKAASNMSGNLSDLMKAALASRPAIYNLRWKDDRKRNTYLATSADTGEDIEFNHLELGKYRQIDENEVLQFRNKAASETVEVDHNEDVSQVAIVEPPVFIAPLPFQDMAEISNDGEGRDNSVQEMVEEARTVEERIAILEERVSKLERSQVVFA